MELLLKTEAAVDVPWPETPEPSAEKCPGGVRFGYFVPVKTETDARSVAQTFQRLWKSEGLTVEPSRQRLSVLPRAHPARGRGRSLKCGEGAPGFVGHRG
ncbi:hypothetical protein ACEN9R_12335 [Curtobacterium sp. CT11-133]